MTWVIYLDLFVIALWVLVGFPAAVWGVWEYRKVGRLLRRREALLNELRERS